MKKQLWAIVFLGLAASAAAQSPQVRIESGRLEGNVAGGVESFLGIPYAVAPVGPLRWAASHAAQPWREVRPAKAYGADCMQEPVPGDAAPLGTKPAEDCLFLNVWRPAGTAANAALPVLVWIHGGGNVNGGSSPAVYKGDAFARDGVIMISFNYRVGRFGFFAFPEVTRQNADYGRFANYGYMDTIDALSWVKRNIAALGGDPAKVTVYGQSAGAGQVQMLLSTPLAQGLFARAIIQSGGEQPRPQFKSEGGTSTIEQAGVNFAKRWGIEGTDFDALAKLRALTPEQIVDGLNLATMDAQSSTYIGPVRDGRVLVSTLVEAVAQKRAHKVPLIIGSTSGDSARPVGADINEAIAAFGRNATQARAAYVKRGVDPAVAMREISRDRTYAEPARFIAASLTAQGQPVYRYRFSYAAASVRGEMTEGATHASDIPYAMETVKDRYGDKTTPQDIAMAQMVHKYWVNFVRTGDPNGPGLPRWDAYDPKGDMLMDFAANGTPRAQKDPFKARLDAAAALAGRAPPQ